MVITIINVININLSERLWVSIKKNKHILTTNLTYYEEYVKEEKLLIQLQ